MKQKTRDWQDRNQGSLQTREAKSPDPVTASELTASFHPYILEGPLFLWLYLQWMPDYPPR